MHKVLDFNDGGKHYTVKKNANDKNNPFWLYLEWYELKLTGGGSNRRKLLAKYANMSSAIYHIAQHIAYYEQKGEYK